MPPADLEIVEVVRRGDLDRTAAGFGIGVLVGDDRDQPAGERQADGFADDIGVTRIPGMHRDPGVAEHRLRPGGRDNDITTRLTLDRVADVPQRAFGLAIFDFEIRDHGVHLRIPIDQPLVAVDQSLAVKRHKNPADRGGQSRVHRKALTPPVRRGAETPQLAGDGAARLLLPFPNSGDEPLTTKFALRPALLGDVAGNNDFGGDAGVIGAGLPEHVAAAHALIADQHILQREGQAHAPYAGSPSRSGAAS